MDRQLYRRVIQAWPSLSPTTKTRIIILLAVRESRNLLTAVLVGVVTGLALATFAGTSFPISCTLGYLAGYYTITAQQVRARRGAHRQTHRVE